MKGSEDLQLPRMTLTRRRPGRYAQCNTTPNSRWLTDSEEKAIIQHIIELSERAFRPRLADVEDMANQLL